MVSRTDAGVMRALGLSAIPSIEIPFLRTEWSASVPENGMELSNSQTLNGSGRRIPILTCIKIADNVLELLLGLAPTLLDLRPFVASQVHIDFTLAAK